MWKILRNYVERLPKRTLCALNQLCENVLPVEGSQEGEWPLGVEDVEQLGLLDELEENGVLGAALVDLADHGPLALEDGGHDLAHDVDDAVAGGVVNGHDGAAVGGHNLRGNSILRPCMQQWEVRLECCICIRF